MSTAQYPGAVHGVARSTIYLNLELMAPVELSIVCFRYVPDSLRGDEEQLDALNKRIMEEVQAGGKAFVNGTILHGRFVLRSCALVRRFGAYEIAS